MNVISINKLTY